MVQKIEIILIGGRVDIFLLIEKILEKYFFVEGRVIGIAQMIKMIFIKVRGEKLFPLRCLR